jgi:LmbE family N-acetylglucosaminyl deacetylase
MKKYIFAIFAHPDDESFGPSGTLLKEVAAGTEVHLMTLTTGQNGMNPDEHADLGAVRLEEWHKAGKLIGATSQHYLGYVDGELRNNLYHEIAAKINSVIDEILENAPENCQIEFLTNDLNGISGHIDHIVAARVACYVFFTRKEKDDRFTRIRLTCIPRSLVTEANTSWLYMEAGRPDEQIDEIVDATDYADKIFAIMRAHHTQRSDGESHIERRGRNVGMNYFIVLS